MVNFDGYRIPKTIQTALRGYILLGRPVNDFLFFVLSNDLVRAVVHADDESCKQLRELGLWLYNRAPDACWGNEAKYLRWIQEHPAKEKEPSIR